MSTNFLDSNKDKGMRTSYSDLLFKNSYRPPPHTSEKSYELQPMVPPPFGGSGQNCTSTKWQRNWPIVEPRKTTQQ